MSIRPLLRPLSLLYTAVQRIDAQAARRRRFVSSLPVISVGNLSVGGTGKTPVCMYLIRRLQEFLPCILLSRGYGRSDGGEKIWRPGEPLPSPSEFGDEPALIARVLRRGGIAVAKDRSRLLRKLQGSGIGSVVILDDGFQHVQIARNCDIVIVDDATARRPWPIPEGILREPSSALRRADIILTTSERAAHVTERWRSPSSRAYAMTIRSSPPRRWIDQASMPDNPRTILVTGIANPERVVQSSLNLDLQIVDRIRFNDHHRYTPQDVERMIEVMRKADATSILTTAKDAVKLELFPQLSDVLYVSDIEPEIERSDELMAAIRNALQRRINT